MKILDVLDKDLRSRSKTCSKCGKPLNGIVRNNETIEESGICVCQFKDGEY